ESAARCLSKSYIALPITIVAIEIARDVLAYGNFKRRETSVVAHAPQSFDAGFGEVLVLAANGLRHVNIFDIHRPAKRIEHRTDHVAETFSSASSDVENAIYSTCAQQPSQNRNGVIDIDEISALLAIGNTLTMRFEQTHRPARPCDIENLGQDTGHVALVIFVWPVDIEKLQANPMGRQFFLLNVPVDHRKIEQVLAPAIEIHRLKLAQRIRRPVIVETMAAIAVSCR